MKIDRLIGITMLLIKEDQVTAPELAERFEVSRRTINRDVEDLCKAGIPVVTTQGFGGGISIEKGYKMDKTFLSRGELQAVVAGLQGLDSISRVSHVRQVLDKLSDRSSQIVADDVIMIDLASHYQDSLRDKIEVLKQAISRRHRVTFAYYSERGEDRRAIEPCRIMFRWSSWYVFGYCLKRKDFRLFKLNRLWNLVDTAEIFGPRQVPEERLNFDAYFEQTAACLKAVFAESEKYRLVEEYGVDCFEEMADGRLLFVRDFSSYTNMREWISGFGNRVKVLEPEQLKEDLIRQAQDILRQYGITDIFEIIEK